MLSAMLGAVESKIVLILKMLRVSWGRKIRKKKHLYKPQYGSASKVNKHRVLWEPVGRTHLI